VETQQLVRGEKGRFAKGSGGRAKGSRNNASKEIKAFAARVLLGDNPEEYLSNVRVRIMQGEAPHMEKFFAEHLWGKPREKLEHSFSGDLVYALGERLRVARERAKAAEVDRMLPAVFTNGDHWPKPAIVAGSEELPE
jgi:hypothetical protein